MVVIFSKLNSSSRGWQGVLKKRVEAQSDDNDIDILGEDSKKSENNFFADALPGVGQGYDPN